MVIKFSSVMDFVGRARRAPLRGDKSTSDVSIPRVDKAAAKNN